MSLLMQALKKAERAKQNALPDEELDKPSQEFDEVLALTPEPAPRGAAPPPAPPLAKRELSLDLEPMADFSLEPMQGQAPAASLTPRPSPSPLPPQSDRKEPGLTLDLAPDPAAPMAPTAPAAPVKTGTAAAASSLGGSAASMASDLDARAAASRTEQAAARAQAASASTQAAASAGRAAQASAPSSATKPASKTDKADAPRGAARARAAAAIAEPSGMDPERVRLIGLISLLALIVCGFAFYYWQAVMAPGAGSRLPPVPMPPPGATGATPVQVIAGPGAANSANPAGDPPAADAADSTMLAPSMNRGGREDLERRLARTEQELATAQHAIQSQLATPRVDKLPAVAAQDSGEIKVARAVQPQRLSPALDGAYQAFNNGDLASAQQQYETALRQDANNRDALLGLASLSARQNQNDKAAAYYLRLLELDPTDATATASLIGLRHGDAGQSESRLKAILAVNPEAAPVLFALGNLYAQQGRWPEAQQAYFRAYSAAPDNPDYAFNLAIGLDRLNQGKLALTYYQRALALAQDKAAGFDRGAVRKRLHELSTAAAASR